MGQFWGWQKGGEKKHVIPPSGQSPPTSAGTHACACVSAHACVSQHVFPIWFHPVPQHWLHADPVHSSFSLSPFIYSLILFSSSIKKKSIHLSLTHSKYLSPLSLSSYLLHFHYCNTKPCASHSSVSNAVMSPQRLSSIWMPHTCRHAPSFLCLQMLTCTLIRTSRITF